MIISHSRKFIFFRGRKLAGESVKHTLATLCSPSDYVSAPPRQHWHLDTIVARGLVNQNQFETYEKITICRDPWDKEVSLWWHIYGGLRVWDIGRAREHFTKWLVDKYTATGPRQKLMPFTEFDRWVFSDGGYGSNPSYSFLIRFEHLQDDFNLLCNRLNVSPMPLAQIHTNSRKLKNHYRDYYTNYTKFLVARHVKKYADFFGYQFQGPAQPNKGKVLNARR